MARSFPLILKMKFSADRMLGRLARWLRLLGYDTLYSNSLANDKFLAMADEGRVLLSRNTSLAGKVKADNFLFIKDNDPKVQLQQVVDLLGLRPDPDNFFTRCTLCNGPLETVDREDVYESVPDYVWTVHDRFSRCRDCGKIYWPGSHLTRSRKEIESLLGI